MALSALPVSAQELTLPVYRLQMAAQDLQRLLNEPWRLVPFPAMVTYEGREYAALVRFRGTTARRLPKHSWRIEFTERAPHGFPKINLDAEYYDHSLARDYLSDQLGRRMGLPEPEMRFVSLIVNGGYYGVYVETEPVDGRFFEERGMGEGELIFAVGHSGRMAPFLNEEQYRVMYDLQERAPGAYDTLGQFQSQLHYGNRVDVSRALSNWIDVDNSLRYFAQQYVLGNWDGFNKNYHIFRRPDRRYILVPWDCDATFGNDWAGNWLNEPERRDFDLLNSQTLFRRLLQQPDGRRRLLDLIRETVEIGLPAVDSLLDPLFDEIRHDVYLDTLKRGSNDEFDVERGRIRGFIAARRQALAGLDDWFHAPDSVVVAFSADYIPRADAPLLVTAALTEEARAVRLDVQDAARQQTYFDLRDDGENGDDEARDGIFSATPDLFRLTFPLHCVVWVYPTEDEGYPFPFCGSYAQPNFPLALPQIRLDPDPPRQGDISIAPVIESPESATFLVGLVNTSGRSLNLSGCIMEVGSGHRRLMLRELPPLGSNDTLFVTNHIEIARSAFPSRTITGALYFPPAEGDTVRLTTPGGRLLAESVVREPLRAEDPPSDVAINEINYHSSRDFDPGDWVELTARRGGHDLTGWRLYDARADHIFTFPQGTRLGEGEFIVVAEDPQAFAALFRDVAPVVGGLYFSFGNSGDDIRLYDSSRALVDWVAYDDDRPWPDEPDGRGPTLELVSPDLSNFNASNWEASQFPADHGTPGAPNSVLNNVAPPALPLIPGDWGIIEAYPNPFNRLVKFSVRAPPRAPVTLALYDCRGRLAVRLRGLADGAGRAHILWDAAGNGTSGAAGLYYARMEGAPRSPPTPILLLK